MIVLDPLIQVAIVALDLYWWVVIGSAILSWLVAFNVVNTSNRLVYTIGDFLWRINEPALRPIRRVLPNLGGIDISPVVLLLAIFFVKELLINVRASLLYGG